MIPVLLSQPPHQPQASSSGPDIVSELGESANVAGHGGTDAEEPARQNDQPASAEEAVRAGYASVLVSTPGAEYTGGQYGQQSEEVHHGADLVHGDSGSESDAPLLGHGAAEGSAADDECRCGHFGRGFGGHGGFGGRGPFDGRGGFGPRGTFGGRGGHHRGGHRHLPGRRGHCSGPFGPGADEDNGPHPSQRPGDHCAAHRGPDGGPHGEFHGHDHPLGFFGLFDNAPPHGPRGPWPHGPHGRHGRGGSFGSFGRPGHHGPGCHHRAGPDMTSEGSDGEEYPRHAKHEHPCRCHGRTSVHTREGHFPFGPRGRGRGSGPHGHHADPLGHCGGEVCHRFGRRGHDGHDHHAHGHHAHGHHAHGHYAHGHHAHGHHAHGHHAHGHGPFGHHAPFPAFAHVECAAH